MEVSEHITYYVDGVFQPSLYKGNAHISNVEMTQMGEPASRFSMTTVKAAIKFEKTAHKTSSVRSCSFHHCQTTIVLNNAKNINIESNLLYKTKHLGLWLSGKNITGINNMVVNFKSAIMPKTGAIHFGSRLSVNNNFISSASTFGYFYPGEDSLSEANYVNNTVYASDIGVLVFGQSTGTVTRISNFMAAHCSFGIYYGAGGSFLGESNILVGNSKAMFSFSAGPSAESHVFGNQRHTYTNNLIVGNSNLFPCGQNNKIGILWPVFSSASPDKP